MTDFDKCSECDGSGWIITKHENSQDSARPCNCREKQIHESRLKFANIPTAFKNMTLKTFNIDVYKKAESKNTVRIACGFVKEYLSQLDAMKDVGMGLYLYSDTKGSGKTRMAASIANELMNVYNMRVKFSVSTKILEEIRQSYDKTSEVKESQLLDALYTTQVLVIDDFGTENTGNDWVKEKFFQIVNERYVNNLITIFTSNYSLSQINYDFRITNRIKERTFEIAFPEESIRDHIAEQNNKKMLDSVLGGGTGGM